MAVGWTSFFLPDWCARPNLEICMFVIVRVTIPVLRPEQSIIA